MEEIKKTENKLLDRTEYLFEMQASSTPSRESIKQDVVKKLGADDKLVSIEKVSSQYGSRNIYINVYVYENGDVMDSLVQKHIQKRNDPAKADSEE